MPSLVCSLHGSTVWREPRQTFMSRVLLLVSVYVGTLASFAQHKVGTHLCDLIPKFYGKDNWMYESEMKLWPHQWVPWCRLCIYQPVSPFTQELKHWVMQCCLSGTAREEGRGENRPLNVITAPKLCGELHSCLGKQVLCSPRYFFPHQEMWMAGGSFWMLTVWRRSLSGAMNAREPYMGMPSLSCSAKLWGQIEIHTWLEGLKGARGISH